MAESLAREKTRSEVPAYEPTATLASLFLAVERHHSRASVVVRTVAGRVERTPDWRFHRHVMRMALYLRERCALEPGEHVALLAPLRPEWLLVDWATVIQGASVVVADPSASDDQLRGLRATWERLCPRVALVEDDATASRILALSGAAGSIERVITLGGDGAPREGVVPFVEALDLGGTLDTAERANTMRARARAVEAGQVAALYPLSGESLTNGDVAARLRVPHPAWSPGAARGGQGDATVFVEEGIPVTPTLHMALYRYVADGMTSMTFGARAGETSGGST